MIASLLKGNIKLHSAMFKNKKTSAEIMDFLKNSDAVKDAKIDNSAGSLYIEYDSGKLPFGKLDEAMPALQKLRSFYESDDFSEADAAETSKIIGQLKKILEA